MGFMDSYKQLEKLCGDMLGEGRVSAYIKEMSDKPRGAYLVSGWEADLKRLRHCRRIRNQIAHEPGCSETDMCLPEDANGWTIFMPASRIKPTLWRFIINIRIRPPNIQSPLQRLLILMPIRAKPKAARPGRRAGKTIMGRHARLRSRGAMTAKTAERTLRLLF